ncbi:MAG TPA: GNAT family N-acetyltransferase [Kofleriaceae bacterium]|nr:GNAT family N-acetyltransferase [Kofleriaceae bacterium]
MHDVQRDYAPLILFYAGDRRHLFSLFRLADDSVAAINRYVNAGVVLVALDVDEVVGHLQLIQTDPWQINSLAVVPSHRRRAIGRALVETAVKHARGVGVRTIEVATAAADLGALRFYQRLGFRMTRIERDAFTESAGYPADAMVDGVPLLDRVWLERAI